MIDGTILQAAQRRFDFEGRVAVKSTVKNKIPVDELEIIWNLCIDHSIQFPLGIQ